MKVLLTGLKEKYRLLITLKYYQNMSYLEIAQSIDIPETRVRSRLFEARLKLKEVLVRSGYF
ncbi:MAG: sigma factor-like helix-turn-helix DNA-binding protein [Bacteroidota bacterium]|nr:sigma factor-like helix-turn-helix DNA-binding protein [Bacteroidota bacterium]